MKPYPTALAFLLLLVICPFAISAQDTPPNGLFLVHHARKAKVRAIYPGMVVSYQLAGENTWFSQQTIASFTDSTIQLTGADELQISKLSALRVHSFGNKEKREALVAGAGGLALSAAGAGFLFHASRTGQDPNFLAPLMFSTGLTVVAVVPFGYVSGILSAKKTYDLTRRWTLAVRPVKGLRKRPRPWRKIS